MIVFLKQFPFPKAAFEHLPSKASPGLEPGAVSRHTSIGGRDAKSRER